MIDVNTQWLARKDGVSITSCPDQGVNICAETGGEDTTVPLPNVSAKILAKVMEYCKFHVAAKVKSDDDKPTKTEEEVSTWDKDFVKVDQATLFELILVCPSDSLGSPPGCSG